MPEKIPNARIGRMGDTPVAKNATEVVKLVVKMALDACKEVYCRRWDSEGSAMQVCSSSRDWWKASRYTSRVGFQARQSVTPEYPARARPALTEDVVGADPEDDEDD